MYGIQKIFNYKRLSENVLCGSFRIGLFVSSDTCKGKGDYTRSPVTPHKQDITGSCCCCRCYIYIYMCVCVCVYVCVCVCVCVCVALYVYVHIYTHTHTDTHTYINILTYTHICVYL